MPKISFTAVTAGMLFMAGTFAFGFHSKKARSDGNFGNSATLCLNPVTGTIVVSSGRQSPPSRARSSSIVRVIEETVVS